VLNLIREFFTLVTSFEVNSLHTSHHGDPLLPVSFWILKFISHGRKLVGSDEEESVRELFTERLVEVVSNFATYSLEQVE